MAQVLTPRESSFWATLDAESRPLKAAETVLKSGSRRLDRKAASPSRAASSPPGGSIFTSGTYLWDGKFW
jgi:hypothetical protein